jgi:hypothetical protein
MVKHSEWTFESFESFESLEMQSNRPMQILVLLIPTRCLEHLKRRSWMEKTLALTTNPSAPNLWFIARHTLSVFLPESHLGEERRSRAEAWQVSADLPALPGWFEVTLKLLEAA